MGTQIALIFGSAPCASWEFLTPLRDRATVFCADGGIHLARQAGFVPQYYIGDGDSGGGPAAGVCSVVLQPEKNVTDMQAAYEHAKALGFREIYLTACTGGRQDHHLANLQLLEDAFSHGVSMTILDEYNAVRFLRNQRQQLDCTGFAYFSILPLDSVLEGVTIENARYPLENVTVRRGDSLTVSNEPLSGPVTVEIRQGSAWLILSQRIS